MALEVNWKYVPCAIEGCYFAFSGYVYRFQVEQRKQIPRGDVELTDTQGIPKPIRLPDGRLLCVVPGCLRDLTNAVEQPPPPSPESYKDPVSGNEGAYTISEDGPDLEACLKIKQAYSLQDACRGFPCIVSGCRELLRAESSTCTYVTFVGPARDRNTIYFARPWFGRVEGNPLLVCKMPDCGREETKKDFPLTSHFSLCMTPHRRWYLGEHYFTRLINPYSQITG